MGSKTLHEVLPDYRTQPSVETCWNAFVDSLEPPPADPLVETYSESFLQLLDDSWTLTNLDSGDIHAVEPRVWPDDFMDTLDVYDLLADMSPTIGPRCWRMSWNPLIWICLFLKKDSRRHFKFFFSNNNKGCKHRVGVIKLQFQTFLGLHDFFDQPFRLGFLAG